MFATGLIVFRETLEAALFVGIVAASTRGLPKRGHWLVLGVGVGVAGSLAMASAMERISALADGLGQEFVTATILALALAMLAWHCIWVSPHARQMAEDAKRLGTCAVCGTASLWAVALAVAMAVLREGAETVLFVAGLMSGSAHGIAAMWAGAVSGLALGVLAGWVVYAGLGRVQPRKLFSVTNALIVLLAGSLASQLAKTLNQADWLTILGQQAWDTSAVLSDDSPLGLLLHGMLGYDASPSQLQLVFYVGTIVLIWVLARQMQARVNATRPPLPSH